MAIYLTYEETQLLELGINETRIIDACFYQSYFKKRFVIMVLPVTVIIIVHNNAFFL